MFMSGPVHQSLNIPIPGGRGIATGSIRRWMTMGDEWTDGRTGLMVLFFSLLYCVKSPCRSLACIIPMRLFLELFAPLRLTLLVRNDIVLLKLGEK